jgi:ClpX C4-type zinc finger
MNRRRFIALIGAAAPGLWLEGTGLIQLPKRMVISISGQCSFCGKASREVFGLAGVMSRPTRICNECIDICLEILSDDLHLHPPPPAPPPDEHLVSDEISVAFDFEPIGLARGTRMPQTRAELEAFIEQARKLLDQSETKPRRRDNELSCSFCDRKQAETGRLIAGAQSYICDVCIFDAAALISMHC